MVFAVDTLEADLVVAGVNVEPRPPRVPRPRADPLPRLPRCVMPPRADPPREADLVTASVGAEPCPPRASRIHAQNHTAAQYQTEQNQRAVNKAAAPDQVTIREKTHR